MKLQVLVDMNLSPEWVTYFAQHQVRATHWSNIGDAAAPDIALMAWARANHFVVFTHDLDFGALLALTHTHGPSVLQVRAQNVLPEYLGPIVLAALEQHQFVLDNGALIVVDPKRVRVRVLPL